MSKKTTDKLIYSSYTCELVMPQSDKVTTVTVNKLKSEKYPEKTPLYKVFLPSENGFYRGLEYTENNTLLGYANDVWRKLKSVQFEPAADEVFGADEINTIGRLSKDDKLIKDAILSIS
ncbi:MAG: hypothetical protein ACOX0Z_02155 [Candidatus Nanosyncoccaceae bacterium]|jgi:hypothetical protein